MDFEHKKCDFQISKSDSGMNFKAVLGGWNWKHFSAAQPWWVIFGFSLSRTKNTLMYVTWLHLTEFTNVIYHVGPDFQNEKAGMCYHSNGVTLLDKNQNKTAK